MPRKTAYRCWQGSDLPNTIFVRNCCDNVGFLMQDELIQAIKVKLKDC